MFCPQCRVAYRPGFTRGTDCDVDLVDELPLARTDWFARNPGDQEDPFCALWQGDDGRLHAELCSVLDEAGIPHNRSPGSPSFQSRDLSGLPHWGALFLVRKSTNRGEGRLRERENRIGVRLEVSHGRQSLLVSSKEQATAREIARQVVEGVPPE